MFLMRYRKLSPKDEITREEIEYNFGRSFHAIGQSPLSGCENSELTGQACCIWRWSTTNGYSLSWRAG